MKKILLLIIMSLLCLASCERSRPNGDSYALEDVLGYELNGITKIEYEELYGCELWREQLDIETTVNKLESLKYDKIADEVVFDQLDVIKTIYVYNKNECIEFDWIINKKLFITTNHGRYTSRQEVDLIDNYHDILYDVNRDLLDQNYRYPTVVKTGSYVYFKVKIVSDAHLSVAVNKELLLPCSAFDNNYCMYRFIMPNEDVQIEISLQEYTDKKIYSLNDILGFDKSEITKISYTGLSDDTVMYEAELEKIREKLDVEYVKLESSIMSGSTEKLLAGLCHFTIYKDEECVNGAWLPDKKVLIITSDDCYISKELIKLFK